MPGTTELTTIDVRVVANVTDDFTLEQVDLIRRTIAAGASDDELALFLSVSKSLGLNPLLKEVWCVKQLNEDGTPKLNRRGEEYPAQIMVGRDGLLAIASRDPAYRGLVSGVVKAGDEFEFGLEEPAHRFGEERGKIIGAYAYVYRRDRRYPTRVFAEWSEHGAPVTRDDKGNLINKWSPWAKYPSAMVRKVAEAQALRLAFVVSGVTADVDAEADEITDAEVIELPAETETSPHARGTRPAQPGAPRPTHDATPTASAPSEQPARSDGSDAAADHQGPSEREIVDEIGSGPLAGQATADVAALCNAAKPMKRADLVRVARWSTRNDEWPAMALAELDAGRARELIIFFENAPDEGRAELIAAVTEWEQRQDDPQGRLT